MNNNGLITSATFQVSEERKVKQEAMMRRCELVKAEKQQLKLTNQLKLQDLSARGFDYKIEYFRLVSNRLLPKQEIYCIRRALELGGLSGKELGQLINPRGGITKITVRKNSETWSGIAKCRADESFVHALGLSFALIDLEKKLWSALETSHAESLV